MIRAAVFDVDGTLLDSMPIWRDVGARYLRSLGLAPEPGLADILFPMSFEEGARYLKDRYGLGQSREEVQAGVSAIIDGFYRREVALKPGAASFLAELAERGVPMALATTGDPPLVAAALERLGVAGYFSRTFTCAELDTTKRRPDIYLAAAAYLGVAPAETAAFEDVLHALRAAGDAGFFTVAVEDAESRGDREAIRACAKVYLRDFRDFASFWKLAGT